MSQTFHNIIRFSLGAFASILEPLFYGRKVLVQVFFGFIIMQV
jgi:hypothetical protein